MHFGTGSKLLVGGLAVAALALALGSAPAVADEFDFQKGASLASALAQSRAQNRILLSENKNSSGCEDRSFLSAEIVKAPAMLAKTAEVKEKKWQEQWTVNRCGKQVGYLVFFTEVGLGGTFFSVVENE